ncbi:hypothetical protein LCGC14_1507120, partial [marine sediment metagenome]
MPLPPNEDVEDDNMGLLNSLVITYNDLIIEHQFEYIHFVETGRKTKTVVWSCRNNRSNEELGEVRWHSAWRQYCY